MHEKDLGIGLPRRTASRGHSEIGQARERLYGGDHHVGDAPRSPAARSTAGRAPSAPQPSAISALRPRPHPAGERSDPGHAESSGPGTPGFGARAERLMRLAEQEAADMRAAAISEAGRIVDGAREQADVARRHVEAELARRRVAQQQAEASWHSEKRHQQRQITHTLATARHAALRVLEAARIDADGTRQDAEARARATVADAERTAARREDDAAREVDRLAVLHDSTHARLRAMYKVLADTVATAHGPEHPGSAPGRRRLAAVPSAEDEAAS